jgi:5-methylthioadenosine/S-adenosylhomocysteine deaminase
MYWQPGASARAVRDAGLRATIGGPLFDVEGGTEEMKAGARESLDELATLGARIEASLAPHAIYTVSEELLSWAAELSREREVPVQIHLSETAQEVEECLARHGVRPAAYLDRLGALGERTVLAHGVWLDPEELELIAERGCAVVANPAANMKLAVGGVLPYPAAREAGVAVGLGTDGAGSNDSLDVLSDLKLFALSQRHAAGDATVVPAKEAWEVATGARAPLLTAEAHQVQGEMGPRRDALWVGGPADFLLLRRDAYELATGDLYADLVYAASGSVVDTTVVAGRVLMRGGVVEGAEEVVAKAAERARGLGIG